MILTFLLTCTYNFILCSESHSSKAKAQIPPAYMSVKEENARKLARKKQADDENKELFSGVFDCWLCVLLM